MTDNPPLNIPVIDALVDPAPHNPPAGDWTDDDGAAIDSYLEAANQGPLLYAVVEAVKQQLGGPKASRLITRTYTLTQTSTVPIPAMQALPADPNRTILVLQTQKDTAKAGIYMGEENFTVYDAPDAAGRSTQAFHLPPATQLVLPNYTGSLWLATSDLTGLLSRVDVLAVTF